MSSAQREPIAVYVHIPFCPSKCGYCDFNSYAVASPRPENGATTQTPADDGSGKAGSDHREKGLELSLVPRTVAAIIEDIRTSPASGTPAKTIFFGGGTPTSLSAEDLTAVLKAVMEAHPPIPGAEITSEANPGTVDAEKFAAMREAGFNRLSLGAQSFLESDLLRLGRIHGPGHIGRAVAAARSAGFESLNLDLMFGLPGQTAEGWRRNLEEAAALDPDHLSLYCLTIEPRTAFKRLYDTGQLILPDDDEQLAMYDEARAFASARGYMQYEISNFARAGQECRHNLAYWRCEPYAAYGPGAVSCLPSAVSCLPRAASLAAEMAGPARSEGGSGTASLAAGSGDTGLGWVRATRKLHPRRYCEAVESGEGLFANEEALGPDELALERVMLGLRLAEGLRLDCLAFLGRDLPPAGLQTILDRGWGQIQADRLILTREGQNFCTDAALLLA